MYTLCLQKNERKKNFRVPTSFDIHPDIDTKSVDKIRFKTHAKGMQEGCGHSHISTHLLREKCRVFLVNLFLFVDTKLTGAHVDEEEKSAAVPG